MTETLLHRRCQIIDAEDLGHGYNLDEQGFHDEGNGMDLDEMGQERQSGFGSEDSTSSDEASIQSESSDDGATEEGSSSDPDEIDEPQDDVTSDDLIHVLQERFGDEWQQQLHGIRE
jgi:hypothetical protein